jgi:hypothetical protein
MATREIYHRKHDKISVLPAVLLLHLEHLPPYWKVESRKSKADNGYTVRPKKNFNLKREFKKRIPVVTYPNPRFI